METPPTPDHVQPDEEVDIPSRPISLDLDLNPDLEEEDENIKSPALQNTSRDMAAKFSSNIENLPPVFSPVRISVSLWTLPFEDAYQQVKKQFVEGTKRQPITLSQQSNFVNYVDAQLLQIQRKFIKNQAESAITYTPTQIIDDLLPVVDLLWILLLSHDPLFGQEEYYIKILGDLEDWLAYYTLPSLATLLASNTNFFVKFFDLFQKFDTQVSFLIDGYYANNRISKMSATEVVRLSPIVMRLRLTIVQKLEHSRAVLDAARNIPATDEALNVLDVEIGRLFEGILERI
ncbi:hypothetical protein METBIDRAFT_36511 [Metschnikowia bicuspidata var. bicuspidata NRRL YB-4993]|uniref:Uncharacterized protein n=1 Tax=Metschnikowia bicuspidata var. bicuspidata NRRL YB-4993 TaxID=869754 RepID=A0A1A0HI58_9ASCO|nr:hypothetical protein METBIDRAFT_36511 [Metschnikowia bicuspidata var. bicuspidata NRRL YB-4993]OBA23528.1 hypothetical protein METBIDRAFT_36511 [Metschnikowia bicuspidata var. bicuspidata NRRL YB-4993]